MIKKNLTFIFIFLLFFISKTYAQLDSTEITSTVPELIKFHDVIYLIWHDAYPNKDIKQLKSYVDDNKTHIENINNAKLPGILRDKENKWKEGLVDLNKTAEDYYAAANGNDDQQMLDAAEKLHSKFEMMVRVIKPLTKEIDDFHKSLYVLYHRYYPEKLYADIFSISGDLVSKAEIVMNIPDDKLPKRIASKIPEYRTAAKNLYNATVTLAEVSKTTNLSEIDAAVEFMHSKYQALESIFD